MLLSSEIRKTAILNAEIFDKINYNELSSSIIKMNRNWRAA